MSAPFTTVMADPGWRYADRLRMSSTKRSSIDQYKTTLTVEEICNLYRPSKVEQVGPALSIYAPGVLCDQYAVADEGFLWLWVTPSMLLDGSGTTVCYAWGFEPKQIGIWIKGRIQTTQPMPGAVDANLILQIGMGWCLRNVAEFFIIATRGKYTSLLKSKAEPNLILAPDDAIILASKREHSRKPDEIYNKIERVCPGPYLELFAKSRRDGWTSYGDELPPDPIATELDRQAAQYRQQGDHTAAATVATAAAARRGDAIFPDPGLEWPA